MRRISGLMAAALCLSTSMSGAAGQGGTFSAVATGAVSAKLTGRSSHRIMPDGRLVIVLSASTPSPVAIVITRDAGAMPAAETVFALASESCDSDAPSADDVERTGGFTVTVRGGPLAAPEWAASAQAGTLTISGSASRIAGRFDFSACGENLKSGDRVEVKLEGVFEAGQPK